MTDIIEEELSTTTSIPTTTVSTTTETVSTTSKPFSSILDLIPSFNTTLLNSSLNRTVEIVRNIINLGRFRRDTKFVETDLEVTEALEVPVAFVPDSHSMDGGLVKSGKLITGQVYLRLPFLEEESQDFSTDEPTTTTLAPSTE